MMLAILASIRSLFLSARATGVKRPFMGRRFVGRERANPRTARNRKPHKAPASKLTTCNPGRRRRHRDTGLHARYLATVVQYRDGQLPAQKRARCLRFGL